ncbi:MAG TPA: DUF883 C-terminal domain-containing protein [Burkholderiales bacterium]|jgi:ElaB/YqjD/DUF883 family membrane-anchored ribosome-binding protein|nr:DUF883 C-terminal domain-containing protein [Burkholderiales bacterium]
MDQVEMQSKLDQSKQQINELLTRGQAYAAEFGAKTQAQLRERPFVAVAGAVALGFIVGALLARRRSRDS